MIAIETYLRTYSGEFVPFDQLSPGREDIDLVEGAVEVAVDSDSILGIRYWDYVFPLWAHLAAAVKDLLATGEATFGLPDQAVDVDLRRTSDGLHLLVRGGPSRQELVVSEPQFVQAVRARGAEYFRAMRTRYPAEREGVDLSLANLMEDPPGVRFSDVPWETRIDTRQVAAFHQAERVLGRRFGPLEREGILSALAGRCRSYDDCLSIIMEAARG